MQVCSSRIKPAKGRAGGRITDNLHHFPNSFGDIVEATEGIKKDISGLADDLPVHRLDSQMRNQTNYFRIT